MLYLGWIIAAFLIGLIVGIIALLFYSFLLVDILGPEEEDNVPRETGE